MKIPLGALYYFKKKNKNEYRSIGAKIIGYL